MPTKFTPVKEFYMHPSLTLLRLHSAQHTRHTGHTMPP